MQSAAPGQAAGLGSDPPAIGPEEASTPAFAPLNSPGFAHRVSHAILTASLGHDVPARFAFAFSISDSKLCLREESSS
jgi:hypothetical protein